MTKVAVVKADSYDTKVVEQAMQELLAELGGMSQLIKPGDKVLIKPNMLEGLPPEKAVTTHPEVMRAVIKAVQNAGAIAMVGDSPGLGSMLKVAEKCGILAVCREEGAELISFAEAVEVPYPQGRVMKKFMLATAYHNADKVLSVAKMKTHAFMGVTGAVKNLFGFFVGTDKAQFHLRMKKMSDFANMLVDLYGLIKPSLSIIDGISGMEGAGPRNGAPIQSKLLLAGHCGFAVDLAMAEMMGFQAEKLPVAAAALAAGLSPSLADVELIGSGKLTRYKFQEPNTVDSLEGRLPAWLVQFSQNQFTARPHIAPHCIACGRCAEHCPPQAITIRNKKAVIDYQRCIRCYCCQELCPANAVNLKDGLLLKLTKRARSM